MAGLRAGLLFAIKLINPKIDRVKETNSDMFANVILNEQPNCINRTFEPDIMFFKHNKSFWFCYVFTLKSTQQNC